MYCIDVNVGWEMGHRLSQGYEGPCSAIHGHSYKATFTFEQDTLDEVGFVRDFKDVKHAIKKYIDEQYDHIIMIHENDPHRAALEAITPVVCMNCNPTAENIAHALFVAFKSVKGWPKLREVAIAETDSFSASYHDYGEEE